MCLETIHYFEGINVTVLEIITINTKQFRIFKKWCDREILRTGIVYQVRT